MAGGWRVGLCRSPLVGREQGGVFYCIERGASRSRRDVDGKRVGRDTRATAS